MEAMRENVSMNVHVVVVDYDEFAYVMNLSMTRMMMILLLNAMFEFLYLQLTHQLTEPYLDKYFH